MLEKEFHVTALGELLIDMTPYGTSDQGNSLLEANPGGAPCNVLAMVSKLGGKTAFIGKVGKDAFGDLLEETLLSQNINTEGLVKDPRYCTTLAFVHLDSKGERSFSFYRKPGADMMLEQQEINQSLIKKAKIFHFGTLSMTNEPVLSATKFAIDLAMESGCIISFDPNIRPLLWDSLENAKAQMEYGFSKCHVLKVSEEEIQLATGINDAGKAVQVLCDKFPNIKLVLVTAGEKGSFFYHNNVQGFVEPFLHDETIDTTGAGDAFMGSCLYEIAKCGLSSLNEEKLYHILRFANAAASLVITKKGALKAMPNRETVEDFIKKYEN